ncbi:MAG: hypothetical protein ACE5KM_22975 [Planctomycetaceae bacterium]
MSDILSEDPARDGADDRRDGCNMSQAIVLGEPKTVLSLGPAELRATADWHQDDSDTLAHFIQVHWQIAESSWLKDDCNFTSCGDNTGGRFPDLESFVFVAVYFRQLFSDRDHLFSDACECYVRAVDSPVKAAWVNKEKERCLSAWNEPGLFINNHSREEVFNAMMYGAHLLHSLPSTWKRHRDAFRDILANTPRHKMLFEIHGALRTMLNYVNDVAVVAYQDFAHWLDKGDAPAPDVMWHESVFVSETGDPNL